MPEHVQNLPVLGLNAPGPVSVDPGTARAEVWGLPWRTNVDRGFPGLAYCLGGRSVFFGGWSPRFLDSETPLAWPAAMLSELKSPGGYFACCLCQRIRGCGGIGILEDIIPTAPSTA